jgi:hypothetical protein
VYAPIRQTTTISGPMIAKGARRIAANSGIVASTSTIATTLAMYIEAIRPHTKSGC